MTWDSFHMYNQIQSDLVLLAMDGATVSLTFIDI